MDYSNSVLVLLKVFVVGPVDIIDNNSWLDHDGW